MIYFTMEIFFLTGAQTLLSGFESRYVETDKIGFYAVTVLVWRTI